MELQTNIESIYNYQNIPDELKDLFPLKVFSKEKLIVVLRELMKHVVIVRRDTKISLCDIIFRLISINYQLIISDIIFSNFRLMILNKFRYFSEPNQCPDIMAKYKKLYFLIRDNLKGNPSLQEMILRKMKEHRFSVQVLLTKVSLPKELVEKLIDN